METPIPPNASSTARLRYINISDRVFSNRSNESALCVEFKANSLPFKRQIGIPLYYKGELISEHRPDLIVDDSVIVEVKAVDALAPIHMAQLLTYLKVTSLHVGLILNFNSPTMKQGTRRVVLNASTQG
jgi:GxxExxY protein